MPKKRFIKINGTKLRNEIEKNFGSCVKAAETAGLAQGTLNRACRDNEISKSNFNLIVDTLKIPAELIQPDSIQPEPQIYLKQGVDLEVVAMLINRNNKYLESINETLERVEVILQTSCALSKEDIKSCFKSAFSEL